MHGLILINDINLSHELAQWIAIYCVPMLSTHSGVLWKAPKYVVQASLFLSCTREISLFCLDYYLLILRMMLETFIAYI